MDSLITLILFIIILGFLVFVHELGHFAAAKISKIPVEEFAIGFGPVLFSKKIGETLYRIRALPLGGFVSLEGEHSTTNPNGFRNRNFPVKFFVLIGGVFMNVVTAIILLGLFLGMNDRTFVVPKLTDFNFSNVEKQYEYFPIQVFNIEETYGWSGLAEDDLVVEVNGEKITSLKEFQEIIDANRGETLEITTLNLENLDLNTKTTVIGELPTDTFQVEIVSFSPDSKVTQYLTAGDVIESINGNFFTNRDDFLKILSEVQGTTATFTLHHADEEEGLEIVIPVPNADKNGTILGAAFKYNEGIDYAPLTVSDRLTYFVQYNSNLLAPFSFTWDATWYQLGGIGNLLSTSFKTGDFEEVSESVGGPLAVGGVVSDVVKFQVFETLVPLTAFISLSLAIFNVLPIPALDGGQIAIAAVESIRRKKIKDEIVNRINFTGFAFLMILSVLIIVKDINQLNIVAQIGDAIKSVFGR